MKQTRLLEIIREEIASALKKDELNEIPDFGGRYDKQVSDKYGKDQTLEDATKDITDEILKDMGVSKDDLKKDEDKAKEVLKAIRSKVVGKARDPRVSKALDKQEEFDDSGNALQANQTNNAILKALGLKEPGQRGRKSDPNKTEKPASTGKKGRPAGEPKAEKTATLTKGDDGFDDVSYSDDEEGPSAKDIAGDETAKELGNTPEEKKLKFNQFLSSVKKNKDDKAKIDGILKIAKDKFKFSKQMMDDLKRSAGRDVQ